MRSTLLLIILLAPFIAAAQVFKSVDPNGDVTFSDQPQKGSEEVEIQPVTTFTPPRLTTAPTPTATKKQPPTDYHALEIASPPNDATIRDGSGRITVNVTVSPRLDTANGHAITLDLDGKQAQGPSDTGVFTLENVDRGTHALVAHVRNAEGGIVRSSAPVTVHVHRHSVQRRRP